MNLRSRAAIAVAFVAFVALVALTPSPATTSSGEPPVAPEFKGIGTWLNSEPLTMETLRGRVVLVDFWTYTCINCLNHLPYVQEWHERYREQGLVVVGVHTPEFAFEKSTKKVQAAIARLQIRHPVAQDNDYATWKAFNNHYWPALYLIDKQGRIVYSHFGEGQYEETERAIQVLLAEPPPAVVTP